MMNDKPVIIVGLVLFLAAVTFPVWYDLAAGTAGPQPELPAGESKCVEDRAYMMANHMKMLYEWRNAVVREGRRSHTSTASGDQHEMSLTNTCLRCHNRAKFCNRCHNRTNVNPNCWGCHVDPEEK